MNLVAMFKIKLSNHKGDIFESDDIEISENEFQKIILSSKSNNKFTGTIKSTDFFEVKSIEISCSNYDQLRNEIEFSKYNLEFEGLISMGSNTYSAVGKINGLMMESRQLESIDEIDKIKLKVIKFIPSNTTISGVYY